MIRSLLTLLLVAAIATAARSFLADTTTLTGSGACLAFGFLLIAAVQSAEIFHALSLPHLTAYLLCGLLFGPDLIGLVTPAMLADLTLVKKVAVGLIALLAGCELNFRALRPRLRSIGWISAMYLPATMLSLFAFFAASSAYLPFMSTLPWGQRLAIALLCANVLSALSPAVVIGLLSETRAHGPLSTMSMSLVVVADLLIVVLFSLSSALTRSVFPEHASDGSLIQDLVVHILGSIAVGAMTGALFALYIQKVKAGIGLFVFAVLFVLAEAGSVMHLDPLLAGLSAGLFLENISPVSGREVIRHTEPASVPVFAVFFAVVGAEVHVRSFLTVAPFALAAALVRATGVVAGARAGARIAGIGSPLDRQIPFGMLPQAGVAIGLANLVKQTYPTWGEGASTLLLGTIAINELAGPVLFRAALHRAGEIGRSEEQSAAARPPRASLPWVESPDTDRPAP